MLVKIAPLGERVAEVNVTDGTTIGEALRIAGVSVNERDIKLDNSAATLEDKLYSEGSVIVLAPKMKGGSR